MSEWLEVMMGARDLRKVPQRDLPPGFVLRRYRAGDERAWMEIHEATGAYDPVSPKLFDREFGAAPEELPARQLFVVRDDGAAVATATAWFDPDSPAPSRGRVHWVAVVPAAQRLGLGSVLVWETCRRLTELGHVGAYLTTGAENLPAITLYLSMGFAPEPRSDQERASWRGIHG